MVKVNAKLVSWDEVTEWCRKLAEKIKESKYRPDVIVAIARGGYAPARLLCDFLGIENLLSIQSQHWTEAAISSGKAVLKFAYKIDMSERKILIVDDIADTGKSIITARKFIEKNWNPAEIRIATMQWIPKTCEIKPDFYIDEVKEWIWYQYPWTRLEDTTQFLRRMLREEGKEKKFWSYDEIIKKFIEWYGINVGEWYFKAAIATLVEEGSLSIKEENGKKVYYVVTN